METETDYRRRQWRFSMVELLAALEALLPFARIEIECLAQYVNDFRDDPDHAEDAERVRRGKLALELAERLIARRSAPIEWRQRQWERLHFDLVAQGDGAPVAMGEAAPPSADSATPHGQ